MLGDLANDAALDQLCRDADLVVPVLGMTGVETKEYRAADDILATCK